MVSTPTVHPSPRGQHITSTMLPPLMLLHNQILKNIKGAGDLLMGWPQIRNPLPVLGFDADNFENLIFPIPTFSGFSLNNLL